MEEREKRKKILYIVLGVIVLILLIFMLKSCTSNNNEEENAITSIDLAKSNIVLTVGEEDQLSYTITPSNTNEGTRWITNNSDVATVDNYGNIKAVGTGTAIITLVSDKGVLDYTVVKVVSKKSEDGSYVTVGITEKDIEVKVGSTKKLSYDLDPLDSKYIEVMWESSSPLVASVSNDGVVTGLKSGVTSVTVKLVLSDNSVITDTTTVTVSENASLYLTTSVPDLRLGEVVRLSAAISTTDVSLTDGTVKVSKDNYVSVSNVSVSDGYLMFDVKGLKAGNVTLKLSGITSDGKTLSLDVPITVVKFSELYISSGNKEINIGNSFILSGRLEPSIEGEMDVTCKSSNEKSVSVEAVSPNGEYNGACKITGIKEGSSTITMTISDQKKTIKVTVKKDNTTEPINPNDPSNPDNPNNPSNPDNPNDPSNPDNPNNPLNPDNPNDPSNPDNPNNPVGSARLNVTLDKTTYSINDTAVITVTFTDENGNTKTLSTGEYTVATEFDSTSLGTKKLIVVYPYKDSSLKGEVEYTISGGSSSEITTPPGSGGYNSSSGGGGGGGKAAGVYKTTSIVELTDNNRKNSEGNYEGKVEVKVKEQGWSTADYDNVLVSFKCKMSEADCKKATHVDMWNSDKFEVQDVQLVKAGNVTTIGGAYTAIYRNDKGTWKHDETYYDKNSSELNEVISENVYLGTGHAVNNATGLNPVYDKNGNLISLVEGEYNPTNPSQTDNKLELSASTLWLSTVHTVSVIKYTAMPSAGWEFSSLTYSNSSGNARDSRSNASGTFPVIQPGIITVTATFKNTNTDKELNIEKSIEIKEDKDEPNCSISYNENAQTITVTAHDKYDNSGLASLVPNNSKLLGNKKVNMELKSHFQHTYTVNYGGYITFTVKDKAGNSGTCSKTIESNSCFTYANCNVEDGTINNCSACKEAGCENDADTVAALYKCKPKNTSISDIKYIYYSLDKARTETTLTSTKDGDTPIKYEYTPKEEIELKFDLTKFGDTVYTCTLQSGGDSLKNYDAYSCIDNKHEYVEADTNFNQMYKKNCLICGCNKWTDWFSKDENVTYLELNSKNGINPQASSDNIQIFKIRKKFLVSGGCNEGNLEEDSKSIFSCNNIANGASIGGKLITCP